jgi:hypothetical protein
MLGKDLYKQDGSYYPLFIGSRSVYAMKNESATTIAGTWVPPFSERNAFRAAVRSWPLTDVGKAAVANFDPKATAQKDCVPVGAPNLMFYAVADTITVRETSSSVHFVEFFSSVASVGPGGPTGSRLAPLRTKIFFGSTFASNTRPMKQLLISSQF